MKHFLIFCTLSATTLSYSQNTYPWPQSGNIGIGIDNPGGKTLHVRANAADHSSIIENSNSSGWGIIFNSANDPLRVGPLGDYTGGYLKVAGNGNVGIGNSSPAFTLDVNGNGRFISNLDVGSTFNTNIQMATSSWGAHNAILFNAYKSPVQSSGNLMDNGNVKQSFNGGTDTNGAGAIMFLGNSGSMDFLVSGTSLGANQSVSWGEIKMTIKRNGNVGIGTSSPTSKLTVAGDINSREIKVTVNAGTGPDYVFEPTYTLTSLDSVQSYINQNKHLPEVPSAKQMEANGVNLGEMNMLLLKKVEELMLYAIEANKKIEAQDKQIQKILKTVKVK